MNETIKKIFNIILFYIVRLSLVSLAIYISYLIVINQFKPKITQELCLTDSQNCSQIEIYRLGSSFIAKEQISEIWFWYNGIYLFVYGQAGGTCETQNNVSFSPVSTFKLSLNNGDINFQQYANQCIPTYFDIINNYVTNGSKKETILLYRKDPTEINSIFNVIKNMYNNKIFSL